MLLRNCGHQLYAESVGDVPCREVATAANSGPRYTAHEQLLSDVEQGSAVSELLPGKTDPTVLAQRVAEGIRAGVRSVIEACLLLVEALRLLETDSLLLDQFRLALVGENVIPRRSARLGFEKSHLSMLRKIGEFAFLLLDDAIFRYLEPGRSILYYVIRLYEELSGSHRDRIARLVELFEAEGGLSRDFLIEQVKKAERTRQPDTVQAADPWLLATSDRDYDCILMTPIGRRDIRRLVDYADRPPLCLRVHERVSKDAIGIAIARLVDLPTIENKLFPGCGFASISRVLIPQQPADPDVTNTQVVVIATRGQRNSSDLAEFHWLAGAASIDPVSLASRLVPDAENRLHLFATAESDGWNSIIGEANWSPSDE
jgi:hypothetical protein